MLLLVSCQWTQQRSDGDSMRRTYSASRLIGVSVQDMDCVICGIHCGTLHLKSTSGCTQASFIAERTGASATRLRAPLDLQGWEDELLRDFGAPGDACVAFTFDCDSILARPDRRGSPCTSCARHLWVWLRLGSKGSQMGMQPAGLQLFDTRPKSQKESSLFLCCACCVPGRPPPEKLSCKILRPRQSRHMQLLPACAGVRGRRRAPAALPPQLVRPGRSREPGALQLQRGGCGRTAKG